MKATEFHCIKIGAGETERITKKMIMKEGRGRQDGSVTMHPKGPTATMSLQGSLSKSQNYSELRT
jgi:hypothetical protein